MSFDPYPQQKAFLDDDSQNRILIGPRHSGVCSTLMADCANIAASEPTNCTIVIRNLCDVSWIASKIVNILAGDIGHSVDAENPNIISLDNGSFINIKPTDCNVKCLRANVCNENHLYVYESIDDTHMMALDLIGDWKWRVSVGVHDDEEGQDVVRKLKSFQDSRPCEKFSIHSIGGK